MPHTPGVHRNWLMHFYPVTTRDNEIQWVSVIVVEITDQIRAEEALRKTEKLAATGRLAASIAHEINNPLEAVTNLLYLLETSPSLDESAAKFVSLAQSELMRGAAITQQTLRFYRQSTSPSHVSIPELLDSIVVLYQPRIVSSHVTVIKRYSRESTLFCFGGELR